MINLEITEKIIARNGLILLSLYCGFMGGKKLIKNYIERKKGQN